MAGTPVVATSLSPVNSAEYRAIAEHNNLVDDVETLRAALSSGGVTAVTELMADHATTKATVDALETLAEELGADHATFKAAVDQIETLIEELHDDHATNKTFEDEVKTDYTALLADVTAIRAVLGGILSGSATLDVASLADGVGATSTVTVTGAALGDFALVSHGVDVAGISVTAYVSAVDTVSVRFQNESGGAVDLASTTIRVRVLPQASFAAPAALTATALAASPAATLTAAKPASAPATLAASTAIPSGPATLSAAVPSATAVDAAGDMTAAKIESAQFSGEIV